MEAVAVDKLIEKAHFHSDIAVAIAEAMDITIQAGNFVTVPVLDARFAAFEVKVEGRFSALEKSIGSVKVWAVNLYAALVIGLATTLAANHYWLVTREDQMQARSDQRFQQVEVHFQQVEAHFQQVEAHFQQVDARLQQMDTELKEIRALLTQPRRRHSS